MNLKNRLVKLKEMKNINITSYIVKETKYICNDEYNKCLDILNKIKSNNNLFYTILIMNPYTNPWFDYIKHINSLFPIE